MRVFKNSLKETFCFVLGAWQEKRSSEITAAIVGFDKAHSSSVRGIIYQHYSCASWILFALIYTWVSV